MEAGADAIVLKMSQAKEPERILVSYSAGERKRASVYFDFAMLEGPGVVSQLADAVSANRVVFGSNSPLFYFESARLKLAEAGLNQWHKTAVLEGNARRLIDAKGSLSHSLMY
jgi:predicted TIM-barrel fold metal-dependent hydrolase